MLERVTLIDSTLLSAVVQTPDYMRDYSLKSSCAQMQGGHAKRLWGSPLLPMEYRTKLIRPYKRNRQPNYMLSRGNVRFSCLLHSGKHSLRALQ